MILSYYLHSLEALDQLASQAPEIRDIKMKVAFKHNGSMFRCMTYDSNDSRFVQQRNTKGHSVYDIKHTNSQPVQK